MGADCTSIGVSRLPEACIVEWICYFDCRLDDRVDGMKFREFFFFRDLEQISGCAGMPTLSLTQRQVLTGAYRPSLDAFAQTARRGLSDAAPARVQQ